MIASKSDLTRRIARFDDRVTVWLWQRPVRAGLLVAAVMFATQSTVLLFYGAYGWVAFFLVLQLAAGLGGAQWQVRKTLPKWMRALDEGRVDAVPVLWRGAVRMYAEDATQPLPKGD